VIRDLFPSLFAGWTAPGWLAVELGEHTVRLAYVRPAGARPAVEFAEERAWDAKDPKSLERVTREFGANRFRCTTLLKPADYQILLVEAPAVKREELKDRKSTRLNSSHEWISYAVFCLKKKKQTIISST